MRGDRGTSAYQALHGCNSRDSRGVDDIRRVNEIANRVVICNRRIRSRGKDKVVGSGTTDQRVGASSAPYRVIPGLAIEGLGSYAMPGYDAGGPALVVGYATPPGHAYSTAVARLCAVLAPS